MLGNVEHECTGVPECMNDVQHACNTPRAETEAASKRARAPPHMPSPRAPTRTLEAANNGRTTRSERESMCGDGRSSVQAIGEWAARTRVCKQAERRTREEASERGARACQREQRERQRPRARKGDREKIECAVARLVNKYRAPGVPYGLPLRLLLVYETHHGAACSDLFAFVFARCWRFCFCFCFCCCFRALLLSGTPSHCCSLPPSLRTCALPHSGAVHHMRPSSAPLPP